MSPEALECIEVDTSSRSKRIRDEQPEELEPIVRKRKATKSTPNKYLQDDKRVR
jgi:hypothetical protein